MFRVRGVVCASVAMVGALLLSACSGGGEDKASDSGSSGSELSFTSGTAQANNAQAKTGDWADSATPVQSARNQVARKWVQLSAGRASGLDPVVVNGAGFTLYRFDKDTADPSVSNCSGQCASIWPPYLVAPGGKVFLDGIDEDSVDYIRRGNAWQVTIGGWPTYLHSKDTKAGDANGQGVGGTWFGVTPDGKKAGGDSGGVGGANPGEGAQPSAAPTASPTSPPARSAIFSDVPDFGDPSQGVAGVGCHAVSFSGSVQMTGFAKIWDGENCTGNSKVVEGNIKDLAAIGFPNVRSIRFSEGAQPSAAPTASPTSPPARSAIFSDVPDFGDPSQGVAGVGCHAVSFSGSVQMTGFAKIWDGENCTGNSKVVEGNIKDLAAIGFPNVRSVRFS